MFFSIVLLINSALIAIKQNKVKNHNNKNDKTTPSNNTTNNLSLNLILIHVSTVSNTLFYLSTFSGLQCL